MDNQSQNSGNITGEEQRLPFSKCIPLLILFLISSLFTFFFLRFSDVILFVPFFAITTAFATYLLYGLKNVAIFIIPLASACLCFPNYLAALICFFVMALVSVLMWVSLSKGAESFSFFITSALVYSVIAGAAFVFLSVMVFGSLKESMEYISRMSIESTKKMLEGYSEDIVSVYLEAAEMTVYLIPTVICAVGFFAAWLNKWILGICSKMAPGKALYTKITKAPTALAVIYIILSLFGFLFSSGMGSTALSLVNVTSVISIIFMGEGVREYFAVICGRGEAKRKFIYIAVGVAALLFLQVSAVSILAYFGAYKTVFNKLSTVKPPKE